MAKAIGIDLGTTYPCVGVWRDEKINIISNEHGVETTPSVVAFTDSERFIGDAAQHQQAQNPGNTVFDIKRLIGRKFDDPNLAEDIKRYPYKVINNGGKPKIEVITMGDTKQFTPEEVSSMILTKLKQSACAYLGHEVKNVVITVPAYFNKSQRQATKNAAIKAGLKVLRILKEPTAAALAYKLDENLNGKRNVLVYDLGGGKFDVTILTINKGTLFEVQAMAGDMHGDVNNCLVAHLANEFQKKFEKDLRSDMVAMNKLQIAAEQAKKTLSAEANTTIDIKSLFEEIDFHAKITREHFERLCDDLFQSTKQHVRMALADSRLGIEDIHDIVLVGDSTKIPKIQALVQEFFVGQEVHKSIDPEQVVTYGAALQAAVYKRYAKRPGRTQRQRVRRSKMISEEDSENSL